MARTYAAWVAPLALEFRENRAQVLGFARSLPSEAWGRPSPLDGWTYKDILAHLASGNDNQLQVLLRSVVTRTRLDPEMFGDSDRQNARNTAERRGRTVEELIAELEQDGEVIDELMAQLGDEDGDRRQKGFDQSFGEALPLFTGHDLEHLRQLKTPLP